MPKSANAFLHVAIVGCRLSRRGKQLAGCALLSRSRNWFVQTLWTGELNVSCWWKVAFAARLEQDRSLPCSFSLDKLVVGVLVSELHQNDCLQSFGYAWITDA